MEPATELAPVKPIKKATPAPAPKVAKAQKVEKPPVKKEPVVVEEKKPEAPAETPCACACMSFAGVYKGAKALYAKHVPEVLAVKIMTLLVLALAYIPAKYVPGDEDKLSPMALDGLILAWLGVADVKAAEISTTVTEKTTAVKSQVEGKVVEVKAVVEPHVEAVKTAVVDKVEEVKAVVTPAVDAVKAKAQELKTEAVTKAEPLAEKYSAAVEAVKSKAQELKTEAVTKAEPVTSFVTEKYTVASGKVLEMKGKAESHVEGATLKLIAVKTIVVDASGQVLAFLTEEVVTPVKKDGLNAVVPTLTGLKDKALAQANPVLDTYKEKGVAGLQELLMAMYAALCSKFTTTLSTVTAERAAVPVDPSQQ